MKLSICSCSSINVDTINQKTNLIFLIIIGLFLSALISQNGVVLLLAFPFLSYLIAGYFAAPSDVRLKISREIRSLELGKMIPIQ